MHSSLDKNRLSTVEGAEAANFSTLNIKERAKTARKKEDWGVQGYYCPTNNWLFHRAKSFMSKTKKENIIAIEARHKIDIPAPNMYSSIPDWSKNTKGKFPKSQRNTLIDQILAQKKLRLPGPGTYELPKLEVF